jgi:hypothetical protein
MMTNAPARLQAIACPAIIGLALVAMPTLGMNAIAESHREAEVIDDLHADVLSDEGFPTAAQCKRRNDQSSENL